MQKEYLSDMNRTRIFKTLIITSISASTIISGCKKGTQQSNSTGTDKPTARLEIYVDRGAFEYDSFSLRDTVLTYHPSKEGFEKDSTYSKKIVKHISKKQKDSLFAYIITHNVLNSSDHYSNETTDNSLLEITIIQNQKTKRISCDDFQRGCPDKIQYFEELFIQWIEVDLRRKLLPG
ncbi:hypothetical protein [uncultured Aquimarina sp.]|uniref:hypothetical protein n=1 Tax=uncultured Aquimarina sp. TaxID=575652 RepID=UPI002634FF1C|nr:hypothetical protein [uncultured Aquimarina sp.]